MAYCTQAEIEALTGYGYQDFRQGDASMTSNQWASLVTALIAGVSQQINLYCRRESFESAEYVEYHDGRGMTGEKGRSYREIDLNLLPREQPVISVSKVEIDQNSIQEIPSWKEMTVRSALNGGHYAVLVDGSLTRIRFHSEVPRAGQKNVRITYTAGYASNSPVLADIKLIALDIIANILGKKKREQEAAVASFGTGTSEGANLIQMIRPEIITDDVKIRLALYRRSRRGQAWH
jgi:hypothetical protein